MWGPDSRELFYMRPGGVGEMMRVALDTEISFRPGIPSLLFEGPYWGPGPNRPLKILPEAFASDPNREERFRREARVLASLNHPNIAQIYGFEEDGDTSALVLELVEGPTLAERIDQASTPDDARMWDLAAEGDRFIFLTSETAAQTTDEEPFDGLIFVEHWFEELTRLVPTN